MYIEPKIEVISFPIDDIVRTSNTEYNPKPGDGDYDEF